MENEDRQPTLQCLIEEIRKLVGTSSQLSFKREKHRNNTLKNRSLLERRKQIEETKNHLKWRLKEMSAVKN